MSTDHPSDSVPTDRPDAARGRWREESGAYQNPITGWAMIALLALTQVADVYMATSVFNLILASQPWVSQLVSVCVGIAATFAAYSLGVERRYGHNALVTFILWLALGLTMAGLRVFEPIMKNGQAEGKDLLVAIAILALYLVAGHGISRQAFALTNPKRAQLRASGRAVSRTDRERAAKEAVLTRLGAALELGEEEKEARRHELELVIAEADAGQRVLKQRARLLVAEIIGRIDATSVYRQPLHPSDDPAQ